MYPFLVRAGKNDQMAAGLDVITDGEQTRLDFNLSFYGYIEGIELEAASPRKFGPPAHDQRGKHAITGELRAPRGLGVVDEFKRLRRLAPAGPTLKASVPGPYTLSGRLVPNARYADRWAITEALLPIVRAELEALARQLALESRVTLLGRVGHEQVGDAMACFDLALLPTHRGAYADIGRSPLKLREYAAAGRAVLAAEIDAVDALAAEPWIAFYRPGDLESFCAAARRLLGDGAHLMLAGRAARAYAEQHFAWPVIAASILAGLPGVSVRLILFDTSLVDLTHLAHDPVEVLLTAQLGGGTNIAQAMRHAETLVAQPTRTVVAPISDFEEGGSVSALVGSVRRLAASGVRLLGLAALSDAGEPWFDRTTAARLVAAGMPVAAMTPDRFAEWLAEVMA